MSVLLVSLTFEGYLMRLQESNLPAGLEPGGGGRSNRCRGSEAFDLPAAGSTALLTLFVILAETDREEPPENVLRRRVDTVVDALKTVAPPRAAVAGLRNAFAALIG
ncbi:hypothetical protein J5Y04_18770 [Kitasatospora sp. RG8]|uniref:hypothetical protein n=1 Tax=Kitasatospora sp. RG8 TaxID=2820815 RepID=UPI001ADEE88B|nr:hypothetical protein [Kitasatospora sp. RG8]MBP0451573.1 hypothetical protein [Kitasatospora sp. RG8]